MVSTRTDGREQTCEIAIVEASNLRRAMYIVSTPVSVQVKISHHDMVVTLWVSPHPEHSKHIDKHSCRILINNPPH